MSELRIALVAEGGTDYVIIEAALKAILNRPFILTKLQPEATKPEMGTGWSGVLKWCEATALRHSGSLDADPTLDQFDLLIIHLDVDVASENYGNAGQQVPLKAAKKGWSILPCAQACPPVINSVAPLISVLDSWLSPVSRGNKTVLCMPSQSSGTWLAVATLPANHALLAGPECNISLESSLAMLPLKYRIRKKVREYRNHADKITNSWVTIKAICTQAVTFESQVLAANFININNVLVAEIESHEAEFPLPV